MSAVYDVPSWIDVHLTREPDDPAGQALASFRSAVDFLTSPDVHALLIMEHNTREKLFEICREELIPFLTNLYAETC